MVTEVQNYGHLVAGAYLDDSIARPSVRAGSAMTNSNSGSVPGADWTQLLRDPYLVGHLQELLQVYREAPAEKRNEVLIEAMRRIKSGQETKPASGKAAEQKEFAPQAPSATPAAASPPFEPDIFTPSWGQDRRKYPRLKCFVAVELRCEGTHAPVWGNLANTSLGGCLVETASPIPTGVNIEIGLWVASGKIWVKGFILNGVVTSSNPCFGVRIKFEGLGGSERESLREFLKFVENSTKGYHYDQGYLAQMKR